MLVGTRFRPQGRDPAYGLDCIGLTALAYRAAGAAPIMPQGYRLRGGSSDEAHAYLRATGFVEIAPDAARAADLLLLRPGPRQLHLAVMTKGCFIHADAGLRRVVETPGRPPWPVVSAWRWGG